MKKQNIAEESNQPLGQNRDTPVLFKRQKNHLDKFSDLDKKYFQYNNKICTRQDNYI